MASPVNVSNLFAELARFGQNGDWEKALKPAGKILQQVPDDAKAFHCKIVCLINLSQFDNAVNAINKNPKLSSDLVFEKAYCLYRLNKVKEALQLLQGVSSPNLKIKELKAQVLYRLEKYEECFDAYRDLIKNSQDDYEDERETNLAAVICNLRAVGSKTDIPNSREDTYELCYNAATALLGQKKYLEAVEKLKKAEDVCRKSLEEDEAPEDEIESELGIIRVQQAFAYQKLGKNDNALKLCNAVVKQRPSDIGLLAVASNNIVSINKDQNVFDSKKRMKSATVDGLENKLTTQQQHQIAINNCLLLLHTNQLEQCKNHIKAVQKKYPWSSEASLLLAAVHCREKQITKAVDVLQEFATERPDLSTNIYLTQAQLLLMQGHVNQACETLLAMKELRYRPGVVSALVALYMSLEDREAATNVLNESVEWWKKNKTKSSELSLLCRSTANFHLRNGQSKMAVECLEELRKNNPKDMKTLAELITAYSQFDPKKAQVLSKELPPAAELSKSIDVDQLESTNWIFGSKYVKKSGKTEPSPAVNKSSGTTDEGVIKKKKKKKKGKLPKNRDVDPDPERWLPKRERSTYKKRKDRRGGGGVGKGTQGASSGAQDMFDATKTTATSPRSGGSSTTTPTSAQSPSLATGPRQQRPLPIQKKKKKQKGGKK